MVGNVNNGVMDETIENCSRIEISTSKENYLRSRSIRGVTPPIENINSVQENLEAFDDNEM